MNIDAKSILKKQKSLFFAIFIGGLFTMLALSSLFYSPQVNSNPSQSIQPQIDFPGDKINPQNIWLERIDSENKAIDQRLKFLEEMLIENKKQIDIKENEINDLKKQIFKQEIQRVSEIPKIESEVNVNQVFFDSPPLPEIVPLPSLAFAVAEEPKRVVSNVKRTIPAGTTVRAVLVSSVDAPCGIYSNSDPQPVKLRILDDGHLPKCVRAQLKGGIIIASVYGDLSNERVYMRIERLTQVKANGDFVETTVAGFVSGEDGKYGVRGTVVDKSAKMVGNAALSGLFAGASQYLQALACANNCCYNNCPPNQCYGNVAGNIGLQGTCNAFDVITDYFIKRAEQIRPVIQVTAGRMVDITFTHGTEMGDLFVQEKISNIRQTYCQEKEECIVP